MKITNKLTLILILLFSFSAYRCEDDVSSDQGSAVLVTQENITDIPGYDWFPMNKKLYNPDTNLVKSIISIFDSRKFQFLIFSKPACSCDATQQLFPHAMKVLDTCGVLDNSYILYSVKGIKTPHPYDTILTLRRIPAMFLMINGKPVFSIIDTLENGTNPKTTIEEMIFRALKENQ